ncbi:ribonuclease E/G [Thalassorhabdus alkalitolerans]|uniref:Ribonuclease E/G n=1 Tax=Thalassorhabdus alkalitolerans TaxID=2282697 RepID=A0ABW0YMK6_9BACI
MREVILNTITLEKRAAIKENGQVAEILIERQQEERLVGNVYKGRVVNVLPGMQAAFVDIGRSKNGFLYRDEVLAYQQLNEEEDTKRKRNISEFVHEGQEIIVQVTKEEFGTKGARLTGVVSLPGKYIVYMPSGNYVGVSKKMSAEEIREEWRRHGHDMKEAEEGMIIRTICEGLAIDDVKEDLAYLRKDWEEICNRGRDVKPPAVLHQEGGIVERIIRDFPITTISRILVDNPVDSQHIKHLLRHDPKDTHKVELYKGTENIFSVHGVEKELERALRRQVWLKNGSYLMIDQTEALTVIDVNTGRFTGSDNLQETIKKTNIEAIKEITKQLRLRDVSGIVIIDFIDMKNETDQEEVLQAFKHALRKDRTKTNVAGMTKLGLVEMTRKKVRQNLNDTLSDPCSVCVGKGTEPSAEALAARTDRLIHEYRFMEEEAMLLEVPAKVLSFLNDKNSHYYVHELEKRYGFKIYLSEALPHIHEEIHVRLLASEETVKERAKKLKRSK